MAALAMRQPAVRIAVPNRHTDRPGIRGRIDTGKRG
jgi:hypothetical protein